MDHSHQRSPTIRIAMQSDVTGILCLLLTSFRRFPLFYTLYSPIQADLGMAKDTLFFWRRRLLLDLLDPMCDVIVAELPVATQQNPPGDYDANSEDMLRWLTEKAGISQLVREGKYMLVGFAIWRQKSDEASNNSQSGSQISWRQWLQKSWVKLETTFWQRVYTRKDIDTDKFKIYLHSEEELCANYYQEPRLQLDNLAVDFRFHRQGIGQRLITWGLARAHELELDVGTEAGPMAVDLYKKMGFREVGLWRVVLSVEEELVMPVLRCSTRSIEEERDGLREVS